MAVFPVRLPVPITASVGTGSGGPSIGGSSRKSAPRYGRPRASVTRRELHPLPIAQDRFVGQVQHALGLELVDRERRAPAMRS